MTSESVKQKMIAMMIAEKITSAESCKTDKSGRERECLGLPGQCTRRVQSMLDNGRELLTIIIHFEKVLSEL
jgi:hypothetical protein